MRIFLTGFRFQLRVAWGAPDTVQVCVTAPLFTLVFMAIAEHAERPDLAPFAIVSPTLMSLWTLALFIAGELIGDERRSGTLEALIAVPARLSTLVIGRIFAVTTLGLLSFAEAWLVAGLVFDRWLAVRHPLPFVLCLVVTALAMAATATIFSPLFILLPSARTVQNTLTYPFYLLSGVLIPVAMLPFWLRPASHLIFLSWSGDLLRDSLAAPAPHDVAARLTAVLALGVASHLIGMALLHRVLRRVRRLGTLSHS
ncbi:ABC transporter permease [Streptomyces melanogenes]|uniref:ABC transporter permease n=1 Tax=Streptomyces melanogenes TaxID=67326 RepID=A0ABZ1XD53_9ACTN|nr:ABC transporter permease [Streptomyces melanogenes]